jgi:hypothetical protein
MDDNLKKLTSSVENSEQIQNFQDQEVAEQALNAWLESLEIKEFMEAVTGE